MTTPRTPKTKVTVGKRTRNTQSTPQHPMNEPTANRKTWTGGTNSSSSGGRGRTLGKKR